MLTRLPAADQLIQDGRCVSCVSGAFWLRLHLLAVAVADFDTITLLTRQTAANQLTQDGRYATSSAGAAEAAELLTNAHTRAPRDITPATSPHKTHLSHATHSCMLQAGAALVGGLRVLHLVHLLWRAAHGRHGEPGCC